eukprot:12410663-Alexandrium_andersonii.AAC.1
MSSTCCRAVTMLRVPSLPHARPTLRSSRRDPWSRSTKKELSSRVAGSEWEPPMGHPVARRTTTSPTSMRSSSAAYAKPRRMSSKVTT